MSLAAILARHGIFAADATACVPGVPRGEREAGAVESVVERGIPRVPAVPATNRKSTQEEIREAYEERAAIMEFDGGQSRDEAERKAFARTLVLLGLPARYRLH